MADRIKPVHGDYAKGAYTFECPGCGEMHIIHTIPDQPSGNGKTAWGFNGNMERPTFTPSLLVRFTEALTDDEIERLHAGEKITPVDVVCHSFITDGMIQFLGDCTHSKAGQTVPLGDL